MFKAKIFFGASKSGRWADEMFNAWIQEHPTVVIIKFKYQHARYGDHSIAILYREENNV